MSHIWMSHVTHMNESRHTYEWVISHIWVSHVTHMNESCHTYEMSHVTHMNESCHTYEWVMSHIWMSHVTHMDESCHTHKWVMSHRTSECSSTTTDTVCQSQLTTQRSGSSTKTLRRCNTRVCAWHDQYIYVTWRLWHMWHDPCKSHIWMSHVTNMHEIWHTYEWVMRHDPRKAHIWMSHVTHMNERCHTYAWVMTHMSESCDTIHAHHAYEWVTSHIWICHVTHMHESWHTYEWVMWHDPRELSRSCSTSHVTRMNESCDPYEWNVTHMHESCHSYEGLMSHIRMSHVAFFKHMRGMTHTYTGHAFLTRVTRPL